MGYQLTFTPKFKKHYKQFPLSLQKKVNSKLKYLSENPAHPSLRTKRIKGSKGLWESSVNMDVRIIWKYEGSSIIFTVDIGHHVVLEKY